MIPLSVPTLTGNEMGYVRRCIEDGWLSSAGPMVDEFETRLASQTAHAHAVALSSGTAALHLSLLAVGVQAGDLVLTQNFSFIATANSIVHAGGEPFFVDSDPLTWNMDVSRVRDILTQCDHIDGELIHPQSGKRVAAIQPAAAYGLYGGISELCELGKMYAVPVVVDAAAAIGAYYKGSELEGLGEAVCISFNGNKTMTTGSGGAVVTNSLDIADRCRHLSTQAKSDNHDYIHDAVGYNFRMAAVNAAVGLGQLDALGSFLERKEEITTRYNGTLSDLPGFASMPLETMKPSCPWLYSMMIAGTSGSELAHSLNKLGIGARRTWRPLSSQPPYVDALTDESKMPVSNKLFEEGICLPSSPTLSDGEIDAVIAAVFDVVTVKKD